MSWAFPDRWLFFVYAAVVILLMFRSSRLRRKLTQQLKWIPSGSHAPKFRGLKNALYVLGLVFTIIAAMGPQWGEKPQPTLQEGLDLCVALDLSQSMRVEDQSPSRLQAAKNQIRLFVERLGSDRVALVGFSGSAFVAAPLTLDHAAFLTFLDPLDPSFISDTSTQLEAGLDACVEALRIRESSADAADAARVILLVSDGEVTSEGNDAVIKEVVDNSIRVFGMAMGTRDGGPVPKRNAEGLLQGYVQDPRTSQAAVSKMDDTAFKKITRATGGEVFYSTDGQSAWASLEAELAELQRRAREGTLRVEREERFMWFLAIGFLILLFDFLLSERGFVALLLFASLATNGALAQVHEPRDPRSTWQTRKGLKTWESEAKPQWSEADPFRSALEHDATDSYLRYNYATQRLLQTIMQAETSSQDTVSKGLGEVSRELMALASDSKTPEALLPQVQYQAGFASEAQKDIPRALSWYYQSLNNNQSTPELVEKSKLNIQRLLISSAGGGGGGSSEGKEESESGEGGKNPQKFSEGKGQAKPKFTGTELNEAQARQILESVRGEERDVQAKKSQAQARERQGKSSETGRSDTSGSKPW